MIRKNVTMGDYAEVGQIKNRLGMMLATPKRRLVNIKQ
jgi:hypothetical protein